MFIDVLGRSRFFIIFDDSFFFDGLKKIIKSIHEGMEMTKKILLSAVASALLSTSVFADGLLTTEKGHDKISIESYNQNGLDIIDLGSLRYTAEVLRSGGSISDPMLSIDITDLELPFHVDNSGNLGLGFDERGRGLTAGEAGAIAGVDLETTVVDQFQLFGTEVVDVDTMTVLGAFHQLNVEDGRVYLQYDGDAGNEAKNGHTYKIIHDVFGPNILGFKYRRGNEKISLDLYSNTLDNNVIDHAEFAPVTPLVPQFKVNCVRKFDGLINFENDRISFVNPAHGERVGFFSTESGNAGDNDTSSTPNDSLINNDRMVFKIENARTNANDSTRWMGGHLSEFRFSASNDNNAFEDTAEWTITADKFAAATVDGVDTLDAPSNTYTVAGHTPFVEHNPADRAPGIEFDDVTNIFTITHEDEAIAAGTTTYEVNFKKMATDTPIRPVAFESVSIDLEGGLAADDEKDRENGDGILVMSVGGDQPVNIDDPHDVTAAGSHYVINDVDDNTTVITPQVEGSATMGQDIGEWMDHAYVAQIAGATENPGVVTTKFFIVNRSCAVATPTFKLIQNGKVAMVKGDSINVDSQSKVTMATLLASPEAQAAGFTSPQFAVEIILGGVAEDFYVYAQSLTSAGATKDLPVYNTSARD